MVERIFTLTHLSLFRHQFKLEHDVNGFIVGASSGTWFWSQVSVISSTLWRYCEPNPCFEIFVCEILW